MSSIEAIPSPEGRQSPGEKPYVVSVLTPGQTMEEWKRELPYANKVNLIFMSAPGGEGQPLEELKPLLQHTARTTTEGSVRMGIGKYDLRNPVSGPPIFPFLKRNSQEQEIAERNQREITIATWEELEASGVKIHKTKGQGISSKWIGFANYNHSKAVQIFLTEEVITDLPEFNLHKENLDASNSALRFRETSEQAKAENSIAKTVERYLDKAYAREPFPDYEEEVTGELLFLADGGRPGRSIIKGKATGLVKERDTEDIFFASQFPPAGSVLKEMIRKAKKGKHVTVLLSNDCQPGGESMDIACFHRRVKRLNNFHVLYANGKVHSKWLLVNSGIIGTGRRETDKMTKGISTSNNLNPAGYWTGTGEMGLLIQDQELLGNMGDRAMEMIATSSEHPQSSSQGIEGGVVN